jgi:hypothetical protein
VRLGDSLKKWSAHSHEIDRKATSRLLDQLTPSFGGLAAAHERRCAAKVSA